MMTTDDILEKLAACRLALKILETVRAKQARFVTVPEHIINHLQKAGTQGMSLAAIRGAIERPVRFTVAKHLAALERTGKVQCVGSTYVVRGLHDPAAPSR
jgi:hypothetical protein